MDEMTGSVKLEHVCELVLPVTGSLNKTDEKYYVAGKYWMQLNPTVTLIASKAVEVRGGIE